MRKKNVGKVILLILCALMLTVLWRHKIQPANSGEAVLTDASASESPEGTTKDIPEYHGKPYAEIDNGKPSFSEKDLTTEAFEHYSNLDSLGRCGSAFANICPESMPDEERGPIGEIHPSGWQVANYHDLIDGNYLFNRCHLIAYSLAGENANEKNLITGTRYLNTEGMQPFELQVLDYVRDTGNHVLYRVTPVFEGDNLVASGVEMEALSVEDRGKGVSFHMFAFNVQPGVIIDYLTGDNRLDPDYKNQSEISSEETPVSESGYILNTNTRRFHRPSCESVKDMKEKNKVSSTKNRQEIINDGYKPCGRCRP